MRSGNNDVALLPASDELDNDILLKDFIVSKGRVARLENVNSFEGTSLEEEFPERSIIRAVAERAGNDRN